MTKKVRAKVEPPAQIERYVAVLGVDDTIDFLLTYGGAELYMPRNPAPDHHLAQRFGVQRARDLARVSEVLPRRVPLQKPWIAAVLHARGLPKSEIARKLHVADKTVRDWLNPRDPRDPPSQLNLPF